MSLIHPSSELSGTTAVPGSYPWFPVVSGSYALIEPVGPSGGSSESLRIVPGWPHVL